MISLDSDFDGLPKLRRYLEDVKSMSYLIVYLYEEIKDLTSEPGEDYFFTRLVRGDYERKNVRL